MEKRGFEKWCSHNPSDNKNLFERLKPISNFEGGDYSIIEHGMAMLALIMLEGYKASMKRDSFSGEYNPFNDKAWDYEEQKKELLNMIEKRKVRELDALVMGGDDLYVTVW